LALRRAAIGLAGAALLAACAVSPDPQSLTFDPFEESNRGIHEINRQIDGAVYGPVARGWGETVPQPVRTGIRNLRNHWRLPSHTVQYALQGRGMHVAETATRFAVNSTFGLAGVIDPATEMGLPYRETNFDETFYVWGIPEGGYLELPFVGPGTQRDWTGWALDQISDPMYYVLPGAAVDGLFVLGGLDIVNDRYELDPALQALLHESADSYTAQRIAYLQNMRARLGGGPEIEELEDIYADY
jgi:phospholipid-binding lipoprotein MlaA